jgi:ribonuclease-3
MSEGNGANGAGSAEPPLDPVAALEARLGFAVPDRRIALAALTHKSYVNEHREEAGLTDNERLEFLGDAVVDLAVSHRLMQKFPDAREGELSKMRAAVVDEQGLAQMARALELGTLLRLGRGEELTGGRRKASLLADAMEAVVAAIFVGGGLEPVLSLVDRFLGDAFARASAGTLDRDFKTQLQELAQSRLRATPRYRVVREIGPDHSKTFEVETDLRGEIVGRGAGRSKKDAEQAAARGALDVLGRRFADELPLGNGVAAIPPDAGIEQQRPAAEAPRPDPVPQPDTGSKDTPASDEPASAAPPRGTATRDSGTSGGPPGERQAVARVRKSSPRVRAARATTRSSGPPAGKGARVKKKTIPAKPAGPKHARKGKPAKK